MKQLILLFAVVLMMGAATPVKSDSVKMTDNEYREILDLTLKITHASLFDGCGPWTAFPNNPSYEYQNCTENGRTCRYERITGTSSSWEVMCIG